MKRLSISEVAKEIGVRPSTIRYYEQIGILLPPERVGGQRRYDRTVLSRLAVIQRARQTGFTLNEIRQLFFGFQTRVPPSERWRKMADKKLLELGELMKQIQTMQELLQRMPNCKCEVLEECGEKILAHRASKC
jgi:DNA-binding transcriptional MerR regulator